MTDDPAFLRAECARIVGHVAAERRHARAKLSGHESRDVLTYGRVILGRAAWYRGHAAFAVLP